MHTLQFRDIAALPVHLHEHQMLLGRQTFPHDTIIEGQNWHLSLSTLERHLRESTHIYGEPFHVPAAAVIFDLNHELDVLGHFLPLISQLSSDERAQFMLRLNTLLRDPRLQIRLPYATAATRMPLSARALIAGQILMCFFYRNDVITTLLTTKPTFDLFLSVADYARGGGVGGGCYDLHAHRVLLHLPRLYEGFFDTIPGVCPLLHEMGHMLDGTSMRQMLYGECRGEFPSMTAAQHSAFARAKAAEYGCYMAHYHGHAPADGRHPLGHPYVFQTDGEFIAGYWEMFWRNPHTMATQCPDLFAALRDYTQSDPRKALPTDYMGYVNGNRAFYRSGERPWPSQIRYHIH